MNKQQFLKELTYHLGKSLPAWETNEIARDQEEFINDAISSGRKEADVIASLGDPKKFATSIIAESKITNAENAGTLNKQVSTTFSALIAFLALAPLNIFVLLCPFLVLLCLLLAGWLMGFSFLAAGFAMIGAFFVQLMSLPVTTATHVAYLSFSVGMITASLLSFIMMYHISRMFLWGTLGYIRWNYNFLKSKI